MTKTCTDTLDLFGFPEERMEKERFRKMCEDTHRSVLESRERERLQTVFYHRLRDEFGMKPYEAMHIAWHFKIENDAQFIQFDVDASFNENYKGWDTEQIKQIQQAISNGSDHGNANR